MCFKWSLKMLIIILNYLTVHFFFWLKNEFDSKYYMHIPQQCAFTGFSKSIATCTLYVHVLWLTHAKKLQRPFFFLCSWWYLMQEVCVHYSDWLLQFNSFYGNISFTIFWSWANSWYMYMKWSENPKSLHCREIYQKIGNHGLDPGKCPLT